MQKNNRLNIPCLALSSENSRATSSNLTPLRSFSSASSFLECFSHYTRANQVLDPIIASTYQSNRSTRKSYQNVARVDRCRSLQFSLSCIITSIFSLPLCRLGFVAAFSVVFRRHGGCLEIFDLLDWRVRMLVRWGWCLRQVCDAGSYITCGGTYRAGSSMGVY